MRLPYVAAAGAVALAAVVLAGDLTAPSRAAVAQPAGRAEVAPVSQLTLACPDVTGNSSAVTTRLTVASASGTGRVAVGLLGRPAAPVLTAADRLYTRSVTSAGGAVAVNASGSIAAGLEAEQTSFTTSGGGRSLADARCVEPAHDWWFSGICTVVNCFDALYLVNPDNAPASADLSLYGDRGPLSPPNADNIVVPPHGRVVLPLDRLAPDVPRLGLHVVASSGRLAAWVRDQRQKGTSPDGTDWITPTQPPATGAVIPGFPTGQGTRSVFVTDPGQDDATVTVRVVTDGGAFIPTGLNAQRVPAGSTARFDVRPAIQNNVAAVVVTSDQPVVVQGNISRGMGGYFTDRAWTAATAPLDRTGALATDVRTAGESSLLLVSAPVASGRVRVQDLQTGRHAVVAVAAGYTVAYRPDLLLPSGSGALLVTPLPGSGPLYAARVLAIDGLHGPLLTVLSLANLPGSVTLPPAAYDPRAALP